MELSQVAELQVLLEGVPLPNGRSTLVRYALHQGADGEQVVILRRLPDRRFETMNEVAEALVGVQPLSEHEVPHRSK